MPESSHDVQAFDCHPISGPSLSLSLSLCPLAPAVQLSLTLPRTSLAGSASGASPPSLVITVSGQVTHGPNPTPASAAVTNKNFDNLPRVFSQSLILTPSAPDPATGEPGYLVASDCFRFC